jgi:hypothetical protein
MAQDYILLSSQLVLRQGVEEKKSNLYQPFIEISKADSLSVSNRMVKFDSWFKKSQLFFYYEEVSGLHMVY